MTKRSATAGNFEFEVVSVGIIAGSDRYMVSFIQVIEGANVAAPNGVYAAGTVTNSISLNLSLEEAQGYFPGQKYTVDFTAAAE